MIALLALLAIQQVSPPPPVVDDQEIIVVGQRLQHMSVTVRRNLLGRYSCATNGTTGHPDIDARLCQAATDCVRYGNRTAEAARACLAGTKPELLAELRRARAGAGR